ncbi:hypothetical protein AJ79_08603 [Helicocarpus griseus UAMH5409]|uniref:Major facilitator superfamily (MFS) profile domain-containing protein n=1 Tax=Helicocarpus griseus UAMH5409 TaxID=1447875 RepID=A0A2B7WRQ1_9EURO|nr:hypothetical protein AJ79_08603 [Helicocarpus griseus UAMH5409]
MASTLLRLAPLVTTTSSLTLCAAQSLYLGPFLHPSVGGISLLMPLYGLTIGTSVANLFFSEPQALKAAGARELYMGGLVFSVLHFAFVPFVMYPVRDIIEDRSKGKSTGDLKKWLGVHFIRSLVVDLPGWACFLGGF